MRSQSAMEYLMTYGWAILIIVIVVVVIFNFNLFNPYTFTPKISPGACQIIRPDGPGSNVFISLEGGSNCDGVLPEYTPFFGGSSNISIPASMLPEGLTPRTVTAWINPSSENGNTGVFYYGGVNCNPDGSIFGLILEGTQLSLWGGCDDSTSTVSVPLNTWSFVAINYTGSTETFFYDGNAEGSPISYTSDACNLSECANAYIGGANGWWGGMFDGYIADVQIYNTSLSTNEIRALYQEGIGGAPIDLQNIVGWWPLDGNANDYSGNGNNGVPSGVTYTSNWESGYSAP